MVIGTGMMAPKMKSLFYREKHSLGRNGARNGARCLISLLLPLKEHLKGTGPPQPGVSEFDSKDKLSEHAWAEGGSNPGSS